MLHYQFGTAKTVMNKIILLLILSLSAKVYGQHLHYKGSLLGNQLIYPGINIQAEKIVYSKEKIKEGKHNKIWKKQRNIIATIDLGAYCHPKMFTALINTYGIKYQKITKRSWFYETGVGFGFARTFLPETYTVKDDGSVKKVFLPGYAYFTPKVDFIWGRQFKKPFLIDQVFIKTSALYLLHYNYTNLPTFSVEIGMGININNLQSQKQK